MKLPLIGHAHLLELLRYDPESGDFYNLVKRARKVNIGQIAGRIGPDGRKYIRIEKKDYISSRLAWFYMTGRWPKELIDHKNRNKSDNRWCNLREANLSQNAANSMWPKNRWGAKGVRFRADRGKFEARIKVNGKQKFLGYYLTLEEASAAYRKAAIFYFGEFALVY